MSLEQQNILNPEQKKAVAAFAKEQCAFLKTAKGFTKALVNQPSHGLLIYRNAMMGIGIQMSYADHGYYYDDIKITIGKLKSDGTLPRFPYIDEAQARSLWLLESFLIRQLHIQEQSILALDQLRQDFHKTRTTWSIEQWKQIISLYRVILHEHIDLIVQQPSEVLFPTAIEYLPLSRAIFAQLTREHFAFLQEYGFRPDPLVEDYGAQYTWINGDRGIQLFHDYQFNDISISVVKLIEGKLPTFNKAALKHDYFIRGSSVAIPLYDLLTKRLGIHDTQIDSIHLIPTLLTIRDFSDYDYTYATTVVRMYADSVRRYISQLIHISLD